MTTVGQALVSGLAARGVDVVFGIPGVHTVELYRGVAGAGIRHVTPRHEQGAGFMADGYARATGRPGVAFVITGPGLTNILTPMAQARADSVPMLVVSSANPVADQGRGLGYLHELPDQSALAAQVAVLSVRVDRPATLGDALDRVFARLTSGRPGPVHLEVPRDVLGAAHPGGPVAAATETAALPDVGAARALLAAARRPVILAGGGARHADAPLRALAEALDAPVVLTVNGRGLLHGHPLVVPASPSLSAVRDLIAGADLVLAVGTEIGRTDCDMYATGTMPRLDRMIRVDVSAAQIAAHPCVAGIVGDAGAVMAALVPSVVRAGDGAARASAARAAAWDEIGAPMRDQCAIVTAIRDARPGALIVGDSTQPVYAGNLYHDHDRPGGWFNAATGYGALGYGIPAAIGAALGRPDSPVICLTGDGGAQFSLPELMVARDENLPVAFVVWNNRAYREIAEAMEAVGVPPIGCDPTPPDFAQIAAACGIPHSRVAMTPAAVAAALAINPGLCMIEITVP